MEYTLDIVKTRKVKTPAKSWEAAGWDFFIPENLSIFDFAKSYTAYLDDSIEYDKTKLYFVPLVFHMVSPRTNGEFKAQLVLKWSDTTAQWAFGVCDFDDKQNSIFNGMNELDNEIIKWLTEDETVVASIEMMPHASVNIPSGIKMNLPENIFLMAANKSGIASKRRLGVLACVTGDTIIETNKGKFTAETLTKEFCDKNEILIKSYNYVTKKYNYKKCDGFRCTGNRDCVKVKFDDGAEISGSNDHCIYENEEWESLETIK